MRTTIPTGATVTVAHDLGAETGTVRGSTNPIPGELRTYTVQFADGTISTWAEDVVTRPCVYCQAEVDSPVAATDFCRFCYYEGRHYTVQFADLIADMAPATAYGAHTGGGCFVLEVPLGDGKVLWATQDQDAGLPDSDDGPWWVFSYDRNDENDGDTMVGEHLDRSGLLAAIAAALPGPRPSTMLAEQDRIRRERWAE